MGAEMCIRDSQKGEQWQYGLAQDEAKLEPNGVSTTGELDSVQGEMSPQEPKPEPKPRCVTTLGQHSVQAAPAFWASFWRSFLIWRGLSRSMMARTVLSRLKGRCREWIPAGRKRPNGVPTGPY